MKLQAFKQNSLKNTKDTKLSPRFFGPYKVLKRVGLVAYRLQLPDSARFHNTFHVSLLKKKIGSHDFAQIDPPVAVVEETPVQPLKILDRKVYKRNNAVAASVLVQWVDQLPEDASWIDFDDLRRRFPQFVGEGASISRKGQCEELGATP